LSIRKRHKESPKFYLFDCGIVRALQRLQGVRFTLQSSAFGEAFEHFIVLELVRLNAYYKKRFQFYYSQTKDGLEIDVVIDRPGDTPVLIEIKSKNLITEKDIKNLHTFQSELKRCPAYCLSMDTIRKKIGNIECVYWNDGLKEIFQ
jgi:uncharacterized protein